MGCLGGFTIAFLCGLWDSRVESRSHFTLSRRVLSTPRFILKAILSAAL